MFNFTTFPMKVSEKSNILIFFISNLVRPQPWKLLIFSKLLNICLVVWPNNCEECNNLQGSKSIFMIARSSHPEVFLGKGVLKLCRKFTGEHPCRSAISIKLESNFIEITLCHGLSPVNFPYILRTPVLKNTSGWLLMDHWF